MDGDRTIRQLTTGMHVFPRRFGKSLMLSTLKAMFECRRELFEGLAIDDPLVEPA